MLAKAVQYSGIRALYGIFTEYPLVDMAEKILFKVSKDIIGSKVRICHRLMYEVLPS